MKEQINTNEALELIAKAKFEVLGKAMWLYSSSKLHRSWPVGGAVHYIIPPIELKQYALLEGSDGLPRGWASWAWLSPQAEAKYIKDPNSLVQEDWKSGDRLWFIDFISPFSFKDTIRLRKLVGKIHANSYLARSIRLRSDSKAVVLEHSGGSADLAKSKELANKFYEEAKQIFKKA